MQISRFTYLRLKHLRLRCLLMMPINGILGLTYQNQNNKSKSSEMTCGGGGHFAYLSASQSLGRRHEHPPRALMPLCFFNPLGSELHKKKKFARIQKHKLKKLLLFFLATVIVRSKYENAGKWHTYYGFFIYDNFYVWTY